MYQKKTMRKATPIQRQLMKIYNDQELALKRLKVTIESVNKAEAEVARLTGSLKGDPIGEYFASIEALEMSDLNRLNPEMFDGRKVIGYYLNEPVTRVKIHQSGKDLKLPKGWVVTDARDIPFRVYDPVTGKKTPEWKEKMETAAHYFSSDFVSDSISEIVRSKSGN